MFFIKNIKNNYLIRKISFFHKNFSYNNNKFITPTHRFVINPRKTLANLSISQIIGHSSFIFLAFSYTNSDMVYLRSFAICANCSTIFYSYYHPFKNKLFLPLYWNCAFLFVNIYNIFNILYDKHKFNKMSSEEKIIYDKIFDACNYLNPILIHKLIKKGDIIKINKNELLTTEGKRNPYVYLMINGTANVIIENKKIYEIKNFQFIGELGMICGIKVSDPIKSTATVKANNNITVLRWKRGYLIDILEENNELLIAFQYIISNDLVRKLLDSKSINRNDEIQLYKKYINQYESLLEFLLQKKNITIHESNILKKFRILHNITDDEHSTILKKIKNNL